MFTCPGCGGRFFKTLEVRYQQPVQQTHVESLLYKKRCKRCKAVYFFALPIHPQNPQIGLITVSDWQKALRYGKQAASYMSTARCALVGNFTKTISADTATVYQSILSRSKNL